MDFHLYATFLLIALTIVGFALERWPLEGVSLAALTALLLLFGLVPYTPEGADTALSMSALLAGFADPALATVLALLVVGQGLFATDAVDALARGVGKFGGPGAWRPLVMVLIVSAVISAFLNNTPVVVIFIPILVVLAAQRSLRPSRVFIPLSYITILGGMTTLIGSSTNLIAAGVAEDYGYSLGFFDITGMGVMLAVSGAIYVLFALPRLLPDRESAAGPKVRSGAQFIGEITLGNQHPFVGMSSKGGMFPGLGDLTLRLLERREEPFLPPFDDMELEPGDTLVVTGTRRAFSKALARGKATQEVPEETEDADAPAPGPGYHLAEAIVAPGSRYSGRTIQLSGLSVRLGVSVLGLQRKSRMARTALSEIRLEPGDTLLIGGPIDNIRAMRGNHDLLLLEHSTEALPQSRKAPIAGLIFLAIVLASAFSVLPIVVAAIAGVAAMLATRCLSLYQAARAFDRQIYLLVGTTLALATAMQVTGGAALIANGAVDLLEGAALPVSLSVFFLVVAVMTNILSNNATAVLFTPIAIGMANGFGVSPEAFIAAVIFGANASFATPIGYQTNLLVMGPGHYRFSDFIKAGTPLVVIIWLTFSLLAPWYYGL
ncbi:SLC13 family permease [Pseudohoeflea coraliihabitans]|uniref:SLC13 family permease n=1 Tax=Pseudohoeflea coraliihabitans TaxID=2860393 RepID=A0ABS6WUM9_9HYPH|nr:SLC13 family permease [Pseudohoeflea sp. DP4N28-3]MBW3098760.1 SLC13 family permease [Pseudohoeflea sp. DP4N28-3]